MKLESTLPESPGFLLVVPAFNLFALLVFFLFGPSFVSQSGVAVELPVSRMDIEMQGNPTVVTVTAGDPPGYWLGREQMGLSQLSERLDALRSGDAATPTAVYLRVEKGVPVEIQRSVAEIALQKGFRAYLLGQPDRSPEPLPAAGKGAR